MNTDSYYQRERYTDVNLQWRIKEYFPAKLEKVLKKTKLKLRGRILDIGCGEGGLASEINRKFRKTSVYGVDISKKGIEHAKSVCVEAKVCDLNKKIPFKDSMFDHVISFEVIEHVVEVDNFVKETKRVLKKNGIGIITTPNLLSWYQRILCMVGIIPTFMELSTEDRTVGLGFLKKITNNKQPVGHVRVFNKNGIEDLLKLHGLKVMEIKSIPIDFPLPFPIGYIFRIIDNFMSKFPSLGSDIIVVFKK